MMQTDRTPVVVGIDNGITGAVCAVNARCRVEAFADTPVLFDKDRKRTRSRYLTGEMLDVLEAMTRQFDVRCVLVEKGQVMQNGGISTYLAGYCEAAWTMACQALDVPSQPIAASTWQSSQLRDAPGKDTKARSLVQASRLFPELALNKLGSHKQTLHGRADAALLARYGVLKLGLLGSQEG